MRIVGSIILALLTLVSSSFSQGYWRQYGQSDLLNKIYGVPGATDSIEKNGLWRVVHGSFAFDTTALKQNSEGLYCYLAGLSASNRYGSGWFARVDSAYPEGFPWNMAFDAGAGKQWVRLSILEKKPIYLSEFGVVPNDPNYSKQNTQIMNAIFKEMYTGSNLSTKVGIAYIPAGEVWVEPEHPGSKYVLNICAGIVVSGMGDGSQKNGTKLILKENSVSAGDTIVVVADTVGATYLLTGDTEVLPGVKAWWHYSSFRDIGINCNATNQPSGSVVGGLIIGSPGEASSVNNVYIAKYNGWGMRIVGNAAPPLRIDAVSLFPETSVIDTTVDYSLSGSKGLWCETSVNATNISGDVGRPLVYITGGQVTINGLKFESASITTPGHTTCLPVVIDSVYHIGNMVNITGIRADGGQELPNVNETAVIIRGKDATYKVPTYIEFANAPGWDNLVKWTIGTESDSVRRPDNDVGQAEQRASAIRLWYYLNYDNTNLIKPYDASGMYYENHKDTLVKTLYYTTDQMFHIVSPYKKISFEDYKNNKLLVLDNFQSYFPAGTTIRTDGQFNIQGNWLIKENAGALNTVGGYATIVLEQTGGIQRLLIKFSNGDVDTLATSEAP